MKVKNNKYIDEILLNMTDVEERRCAYLHLYGVSQSCALIALKRGENAELATIAGMLHDIYSYAKMDIKDHAHKGSILAREILTALNVTNDYETKMICDAIYSHSDKVFLRYNLYLYVKKLKFMLILYIILLVHDCKFMTN